MYYINVTLGINVKIIIVLHGSQDSDYVSSVRYFASRVGVNYAFISYTKPLVSDTIGDLYMPLFVGYGKDYEKAVLMTGFRTPPLLRWPRIKEFLLSMGPGLYVFHGDTNPRFINDVGKLGLHDVAFLKIKQTLEEYVSNHCPDRVIPVVLTRGVIYKEIVNTVNSSCSKTEVLNPLFELDSFINYFKDVLPWLIKNTRPIG
ncbi:hypothetical protein VMUT_1843 [Vulcanisaeta moutnovskia 768-28]|uniref:Uncharacterized protein n=1 Tax=Vulcanisaeta moutnovskia (strain 768-28) TaxID=985053 RepID=F0QVE2_VULM7|nr:hypothetical protein VMUT_1843 [Vulcanisaeta moutnovskia 768-28]